MQDPDHAIAGRRLSRLAAAAAIALFAGIPFLWMLLSSLEPLRNLLGSAASSLRLGDLTMSSYGSLLSADYPRWMLNSLIVSIAVIAGNVVFDAMAAYPLARMRFKGRGMTFGATIAALMIPAQVIAVPLYIEMRNFDWLNSYQAIILPYLASPTGIFLMRQHYLTLPPSLEEAAAVDGANIAKIFWRVVLPNCKAALGTVAVLKFIWTWGEFAWPSIAINSIQRWTVPLGLISFQSQFDTNWPLLMAGSVLAVLPPIVLFLLVQRWFVQGLTSGALKG